MKNSIKNITFMFIKKRLVSSLFFGGGYAIFMACIDYYVYFDLQSFGNYVFQGIFYGVVMEIIWPFHWKENNNTTIEKD